MKIQDLKRWLDEELSRIIQDPLQRATERNLCISHYLELPIETLYTDPTYEVPAAQYQKLQEELQERIEKRIPIQYLLGKTSFYRLSLKVTPQVLIPRPETELLVEKGLEICQSHHYQRVLDLGTGSGCIAICLKKFFPVLEVTATEQSQEALVVAQENAQVQQAEIRFLQGNWFEPIGEEKFDLIISNPPYISRADEETLSPEVLNEPKAALFSIGDPLMLYDSLIASAKQHLSPRGSFLFEIGIGQAEKICESARQHGFFTEVYRDYNQLPRIIWGHVTSPKPADQLDETRNQSC